MDYISANASASPNVVFDVAVMLRESCLSVAAPSQQTDVGNEMKN